MLLTIFTISILFILSLLTLACPAPCDLSDEETKAVYAELAPVVQTIESFHKDKKVCPQTLEELSPKYLEKVPATTGSRKFRYIRTSDGEYDIRVNNRNGGSYSGSCSHSEIENRWKDLSDK